MKTQCERCEKQLSPTDSNVYICSYECTFCNCCSVDELREQCPNCGGVLVKRPTRIDQDGS